MHKRWFIILVLAAVALTAFSFALSRRDSSDWRSTRARRVFPFPWQDAAGITIARPDGRVTTLAKSPDGEWQLLVADDTSDDAAFALIDELAALATLAWREPAADLAVPNPELGVRITAVSQLDQKVELLLGELKNNQRAALVDNAATVYAVNQDLLKFIDWPDVRYRNLQLLVGGPGRRPRAIALSPGGGESDLAVELARTGSEWNITRPTPWPADSQRVDLLLGWAGRLQANAIVAEDTDSPESFGLTDASPRVRFDYRRGDDAFSRTIVFGGETGNPDEIYARVAQRSPVFTVPRQALSEIALDTAAEYPESWINYLRLRSLDLVGGRQPVAIVVEDLLPLPAKLTMEQPRERDAVKWQARLESETRDDETFAVDAPLAGDPSRPLGMLLSGLSRLRVRNFLADAAPGPETLAWTSHPAWRISCRFADGSSSPALTIYAVDDQGTLPPGRAYERGLAAPQEMTTQSGLAFSLQGIPAVMESHPDAAHLLCLPLYRYRSKKIIDSDPRSWNRVEIRSAETVRTYQRDGEGLNEQWWLAGGDRPEPLLDGNNPFAGILLQLSQLRVEAYVAPGTGEPAEFGLDQPDVTAIVYGLDPGRQDEVAEEAVFRLDIGAKSLERVDERYARLNGTGPVFLVPDTLARGLSALYE